MIAPVPVKQPWRIWVKLTHIKTQQNSNHMHNSWDILCLWTVATRSACVTIEWQIIFMWWVERQVTNLKQLVWNRPISHSLYLLAISYYLHGFCCTIHKHAFAAGTFGKWFCGVPDTSFIMAVSLIALWTRIWSTIFSNELPATRQSQMGNLWAISVKFYFLKSITLKWITCSY